MPVSWYETRCSVKRPKGLAVGRRQGQLRRLGSQRVCSIRSPPTPGALASWQVHSGTSVERPTEQLWWSLRLLTADAALDQERRLAEHRQSLDPLAEAENDCLRTMVGAGLHY